MASLENLKNHIEKKNELSNMINKEIENIKSLVLSLTIEDVEELSYEEMKSLYDNISYLSSFTKIKKDYVALMNEKKALLYPEFNKAYHYPMLNDLDLDKETIKKIDNALAVMRVGDFIQPNSSLWRPLKNHLELLVSLGIVERIYELICSDIDDEDDWDYKEIVSETNLVLHKKVWEMYAKLKDVDNEKEKEKLYEEIDKLEVDGYGCICMYEREITTLEEFEKNEKNVFYKVIMTADRTLDKL